MMKNIFQDKFPSRRSHTALLKIRQSQPSLYNTGGLLPTNGQAWADIRSVKLMMMIIASCLIILCRRPLQKPVTSAVSASRFVPALDEVMEDVVTFLHTNLETINSEDFLSSLLKIFMEVTGVITLDHRSDMFLFIVIRNILLFYFKVRLSPSSPGQR